MRFTTYSKNGNTGSGSSIYIGGPIGDIISIILLVPVFALGLVFLGIIGLSLASDNKTKNYVNANAVITDVNVEDENFPHYTLKYTVGTKEVVATNVLGSSDLEVGQKVNIKINPNNFSEVVFASDPIPIPFYLGTILFLSSISVIFFKIRDLLHYINPEKFEKPKENALTSAGMGSSDRELYNEEYNGDRTQIKF